MSTTNNALNSTIGTSANNTVAQHIRAASGQWDNFSDQTDVHGYYSGVGSPNGVVAANIGSIYSDTGSGVIYVKQTDTVNTGWSTVGGASGQVVKATQSITSTTVTTTAVIPFDNTIPQISEGTQVLTHAYTPLSAANNLLIEAYGFITVTGNNVCTSALFDQASVNAIAAVPIGCVVVAESSLYLAVQVAAVSTTARTYELRIGTSNGAISVSTNGFYGTSGRMTIRVTEFLP